MTWLERFSFSICFATALWAQPVLVELFTSEGCSSCPPADALLQALRQSQPVPGATVVAMSEHVDYWNHLGWRDPFSSGAMSARQEAYAKRLGGNGPYTPQMVVDGEAEFVGSDSMQARRAIALAAESPKLELKAEMTSPKKLHVFAPPGKSSGGVYLAVVYDPAVSAVSRGENSGRQLTHVSVVKSLRKIGEMSRNKPLDLEVDAPGERLVIFVQERGQGRVLGVAEVAARQSAGRVARWSPQK
jgi:hypothetical protein